jgi:hypothetical protein
MKRKFYTMSAYIKKSDFEHMIKVRAHKGGVRKGKTPKN